MAAASVDGGVSVTVEHANRKCAEDAAYAQETPHHPLTLPSSDRRSRDDGDGPGILQGILADAGAARPRREGPGGIWCHCLLGPEGNGRVDK